MYLCCGAVVVFASIWLFIGNFINYRLLDRERKREEMYKQAEQEEPAQTETDADDQAAQQLCGNKDGVMQCETNIWTSMQTLDLWRHCQSQSAWRGFIRQITDGEISTCPSTKRALWYRQALCRSFLVAQVQQTSALEQQTVLCSMRCSFESVLYVHTHTGISV